MSIRYDENTKARAVRLVREHRDDYDSEWAAMKAISGRSGMNPETLHKWVRQAEVDAGEAASVSSEERRELRELRRRCRELESTGNPQGRGFLRAGVRPATPLICQFIDEHKGTYGVVPICRALAVRGVQIAPRTYWAHCSSAPSKRALWDTTITEILASVSAQTGSAGAVVAGRKVGNAFAT
jgi:transposase